MQIRDQRSEDGDGEGEGFAEYFVAHRDWLSRRVRLVVPDFADAEDVCAGVFEAAYRKGVYTGTFTIGQQRHWLVDAADKAMKRRARDWVRFHSALERVCRGSTGHSADANTVLMEREAIRDQAARDARVREVVGALQPEHRIVLELRAGGLKGPAIAERIGVSHQLARTRLMFARREFRDQWIRRYGSGLAGNRQRGHRRRQS